MKKLLLFLFIVALFFLATNGEAQSTTYKRPTTIDTVIVSPNPSNGLIGIKISPPPVETFLIQAYDLIGKKVFSQNFNEADISTEGKITIDLPPIKPGLYYLFVKYKDLAIIRRISVQ